MRKQLLGTLFIFPKARRILRRLKSMAISSLISFLSLMLLASTAIAKQGGRLTYNVTYDGKSLIINGKHQLLFSGSIHYTRSPPESWPDLLEKARRGGLNVIQTYVFWNAHEPAQGKFNFEGNYDLVRFLKLVQEKGMYVTLRLGPFIQAEWNFGGLPFWLKDVPKIEFRTDDAPFKIVMEDYVKKIIGMMKENKLFAPEGGPIILAQIENEYTHIQRSYRKMGDSYIQWSANLAVSQNIGVPWVMCKQMDAPDPVINACNGRHCGDTFAGPNKPYKPSIWTENWSAQYRVFGDPPSQRAAEDMAYSVARFFSKNGSLVNYYMYHGGTNFGRTSAAFSTTRYYDEAPLDEYGLEREPKWGHLRDVHRALTLCKKAILTGAASVQKLNQFHEIRVFEKPGRGLCAAFLSNNHSRLAATINFRGQEYFLPRHSISILPDCKTVVYNTRLITAQHSSRNFQRSEDANNLKWEIFSESIPTFKEVPADYHVPRELYTMLKDTTDYGWFTTKLELAPEDMPMKNAITPVLRITSLGHEMVVFVNGEYVGSDHGSHESHEFEFQRPVNLKVGINSITILGSVMGLPDSGAHLERRYAGPKDVFILGLNAGTINIRANNWGHQVGLQGEKQRIFSEEGSKTVQWKKVNGHGPPLSWYKTTFDEPEGKGPVAIRMTGMGKGHMYVNGIDIGRHWMSYLTPLQQPSQSEYHIPRAWIKKNGNLLVVLEEEPANPKDIEILNVDRDTICSSVSEIHPPSVAAFSVKKRKLTTDEDNAKPKATVKCPEHKKILAVEFASFGDPMGACGGYVLGKCNAAAAKQVVEQFCLGKEECSVPVDCSLFLKNGQVDACPQLKKTLAIQVKCSPQ